MNPSKNVTLGHLPKLAMMMTMIVATTAATVWAQAPPANPPEGVYEFKVKQSGKYLTVNGAEGADQLVGTRDLPTAFFRRFWLKSNGDGTVTFFCTGNKRPLHVDDLGDKMASTRAVQEDDFTKFRLVPQEDGTYRISVKATGRFLHLDGEGTKLLSTKFQVDDGYSRFYLVRPISL